MRSVAIKKFNRCYFISVFNTMTEAIEAAKGETGKTFVRGFEKISKRFNIKREGITIIDNPLEVSLMQRELLAVK